MLVLKVKTELTSRNNLVHIIEFSCFSNPLFIPYQNDYQKGKLVLVLLLTFLLSLLMKIYKNVSASLNATSLKGLIFTQRKKGKSKGMGTHLLNQIQFPSMIVYSNYTYVKNRFSIRPKSARCAFNLILIKCTCSLESISCLCYIRSHIDLLLSND